MEHCILRMASILTPTGPWELSQHLQVLISRSDYFVTAGNYTPRVPSPNNIESRTRSISWGLGRTQFPKSSTLCRCWRAGPPVVPPVTLVCRRPPSPHSYRSLVALHQRMFPALSVDVEAELARYRQYADRLRPLVVDSISLVSGALTAGKRVLVEGANAVMLDIDFGEGAVCLPSVLSTGLFYLCFLSGCLPSSAYLSISLY